MKRTTRQSGFAIALTLVLMALIAIVVIAYLVNTRIERSTAAVHANRMRAKITAESALAAATKLLYDNTKNGNYITAMPAPVPVPSSIRTEIYRADDATAPDDFLQLPNALGDVLASRAITTSTTPQLDPRPTITPLPVPAANGSFGMPDPGFTTADSYDFNQFVRIGTNGNARLVNPVAPIQPAFGQWVRVRNSAGELIGRYAFFIEDESMKVNVNTAGNVLGAGQANLRVNDLAIPAPAPTPATQAQEIDPAGALPTGASRANATKALANVGPAGSRIPSQKTVGVLNDWNDNGVTKLSDYAHTITSNSRDDVTTARGWQRMDLNKVVADAGGGNSAKVTAAQKIADWIADAWTGLVPLASFSQDTTGRNYQVYNDERLRRQLASDIVDYIDADNIPTDMGQYPEGDATAPAVIGIEKIPYLAEMDVIYTATNGAVPAPGSVTIGMKFRFNFFNMYDADMRLSDYIGKITVKGVPVVAKNSVRIFNHESETYEVTVGGAKGIPDAVISAGGDNSPNGVAGVKTFLTPDIVSEQVTFVPGLPNSQTSLESGAIEIEVVGKNGERLDSIRLGLRDLPARYKNAASDFLEPTAPDVLPQSAASMNALYEGVPNSTGSITPISYGDPRYRPEVPTHRFYNLTRTDTARFATTSDDKAEIDSRAYAVDWHDYVGNRPLAFLRNGPLQSVGELGNVISAEYAWRTVYLQYAGRPESTVDVNVIPDVQRRRGSFPGQTSAQLPQDYVLMDLFTTSQDKTRSGSININSQYNIHNSAGETDQGAIPALMSAIPIGPMKDGLGATLGGSAFSPNAVKTLSKSIAERRIAVAPATTGGPGASGGAPPIDNNPRRPYFTIGEIASVISRLINQNSMSPPKTTAGGASRSTTIYSVLRTLNPNNPTEFKRDYCDDQQVEEPFRKISNAITTRGNVFRVLFVGQAIKDQKGPGGALGDVESNSEIMAEYLGEAFIERQAVFGPPTTVGNSSAVKTTGAKFRILAQHVVTE
jgi:hypothetical protein